MAADFLCMSLTLAGVLAGAGAMFAAITRKPRRTMGKNHD